MKLQSQFTVFKALHVSDPFKMESDVEGSAKGTIGVTSTKMILLWNFKTSILWFSKKNFYFLKKFPCLDKIKTLRAFIR